MRESMACNCNNDYIWKDDETIDYGNKFIEQG